MTTPNDRLLSNIDSSLREQAAREHALKTEAVEGRVARMRSDANALHRFTAQVGVGLAWVWQHVLRPLTWIFRVVFGWFFRQYRKLWALSVYRRNAVGNLVLSKTRAGLFVLGTALGLLAFVGIASFMFDATMYLATAKVDETIYLTEAQEIDPEGNVHAVRGCESLPCSDTDSVYFRVNPSAFNHAWSLADHGGLFFPDFVAAAVPPGVNRCIVTSYGVRMKFLMRGADIYPELVKASCSPVQGDK